MTKQEILDAIHGKMIISCQAIPGEPLYLEDEIRTAPVRHNNVCAVDGMEATVKQWLGIQ